MTTIEKAKELFDFYSKRNIVWVEEDVFYSSSKKAKECTMKCVEEILKAIDGSDFADARNKMYWLGVRMEVDKFEVSQV